MTVALHDHPFGSISAYYDEELVCLLAREWLDFMLEAHVADAVKS